MKDSRKKRDMIKLEDNANSIKEANGIEGQLVKRNSEINWNLLNELEKRETEPTIQLIIEESEIT